MTQPISSFQNPVIGTLKSWMLQIYEHGGPIPDKMSLDKFKESFLFITDVTSAQFEKYKGSLISLYEMSGNSVPSDLLSALPLSLDGTFSPFISPPPSPVGQITTPLVKAGLSSVLKDDTPKLNTIELKDEPLFMTSPLPPHLHLFELLLLIHKEIDLDSKGPIPEAAGVLYNGRLKVLISHDFVGKSLKVSTSYNVLLFLNYCLADIEFLYILIGYEAPSNIKNLFDVIYKELEEFPEVIDRPEEELFVTLEEAIEKGDLSFETRRLLKELFKQFLTSLDSFSKEDKNAYTMLIKMKLFILIKEFWTDHEKKQFPPTLEEFFTIPNQCLIDVAFPNCINPTLSALLSSTVSPIVQSEKPTKPPSLKRERVEVLPPKPQTLVKRERVEALPPKPQAPLKMGGGGEGAPDAFQVDFKSPITTKGTGYHFTDFREALIALSEGNYALGLEYIILLIRFYDTSLLRETRFPPAREYYIHLKSYFSIVYHYISLVKDCNDTKAIVSENVKMMAELEIHRKGIKDYLERHNPVEQITPILARFKEACLQAYNLKLMSLEEV